MPKKRGPGRPPKAKARKRAVCMRLYATTAEHRRITATAEKAGKSISDFLRDAALAEVGA